MQNVPLVESPVRGNEFQQASTTIASVLLPFVTLTSILTETQRPTWLFTKTVAGTPVTTTVQLETTHSDSVYTQPTQFKTTRLETETFSSSTSQPETTSATPFPTTTPTQSMEDLPNSHISDSSSALIVQTSTHMTGQDSSSLTSGPSTSLLSPTSSSTPSSWSSTREITTASSFSSPTPSSSPVMSSTPEAGAFSGATTSEKTSEQPKTTSHKVGIIVGSAVGAAAFVALSLLACFFFFRRRRRTLQHRRQRSRQRLLRDNDSIISFNDLHQSQSSVFVTRAPSIQFAPSHPPQQRQPVLPEVHPNPAPAVSKQDLSLDWMYLRNENRLTEDSFADLEKSPVSPIIHISPPSRSASNYSRASWEGSLKFLEYYDSPSRSSRYENTYYPAASTSTLPSSDSRRTSKCADTPKTRDSTRSNPFDLEPPPTALQKWPSLPPSLAPGAAIS